MDFESYDAAVQMFDELGVDTANQATGFTATTASVGNLAIMPPPEGSENNYSVRIDLEKKLRFFSF